jgi:hypothetical protein
MSATSQGRLNGVLGQTPIYETFLVLYVPSPIAANTARMDPILCPLYLSVHEQLIVYSVHAIAYLD